MSTSREVRRSPVWARPAIRLFLVNGDLGGHLVVRRHSRRERRGKRGTDRGGEEKGEEEKRGKEGEMARKGRGRRVQDDCLVVSNVKKAQSFLPGTAPYRTARHAVARRFAATVEPCMGRDVIKGDRRRPANDTRGGTPKGGRTWSWRTRSPGSADEVVGCFEHARGGQGERNGKRRKGKREKKTGTALRQRQGKMRRAGGDGSIPSSAG